MTDEEKKAKAEAKALADAEKKAKADDFEIEVGDPEVMRPKVLPLIVKPKGGKWQNEEQAEFAKIVNAYAYKNPDKWNNDLLDEKGVVIPKSAKKYTLVKQLEEIGKHPVVLHRLQGTSADDKGNIKYSNKLMNEELNHE